jgi:hypothetical protein
MFIERKPAHARRQPPGDNADGDKFTTRGTMNPFGRMALLDSAPRL